MPPLPSASQAMAGMAGGLALGMAASRWPGPGWAVLLGPLEAFGAMWLAALQMLVLPLMLSVVVVAIGRAGTARATRLGGWLLLWIIAFLALAAVVTVLLGQLVLQWVPLDEATRAAFQTASATARLASAPQPPSPTVGDWFVHLIPSNLVSAAVRGDLLALIVAAILFGVALRGVSARSRTLLLAVAQAIADWCSALAGLLFVVLPVAVFALTLTTTARSGGQIVAGLAYYVVVVSALLLAGTLALYPLTSRLGGVPMRRFAKAAWPVQVLAFSTRSSVACLPALLSAATGPLRVDPHVASFALPFAVSTFKLNMGISANFQLLFLLHVYGLQPDPVSLAVAVVGVTLQSFATPGLPSGAIWTTTPVYLALGIPLEGIVLTNVVDTIPDLFKTTANVTGDLSIASIVARHARTADAANGAADSTTGVRLDRPEPE